MEKALLLILVISITSPNLTWAKSFRCSSGGATCNALIDYVSPNTTTLSHISRLFDIKNLRTVLGANNLPPTTLGNHSVPAKSTIKIPFPCVCRSDGKGVSNRRPIYKVMPGDTLYHIAAEVFSNLVTYPEIQDINNISNPDKIDVGQRVWIPLPCSCDRVEEQDVVHYGHVVAPGSTAAGIATQYNVSLDTLSNLNNLTNLLAGDVLDIPLRACSSMVNNQSQDYPLLVANDTYVFTATNCVRCKCDAALNWMLQCEPAGFNSSCGPIRCEGSGNLFLGNTTSSGCNRTTCAYAGYNTTTSVLTTLATDSTCPAPVGGGSFATRRRWSGAVILVHIMILCITYLQVQ